MDQAPSPGRGGRFFEIYKRGQGYYTRMCTGFAVGILVLAGGDYIYDQLAVIGREGEAWVLWVRTGIPVVFIVGLLALGWWLVGVNRRSCDFMISTEGEMKKVSWSSRREIIGSTKVVIFFTVLMAIMLFVVDVLFQTFFSTIGVLKSARMYDALKGFFLSLFGFE